MKVLIATLILSIICILIIGFAYFKYRDKVNKSIRILGIVFISILICINTLLLSINFSSKKSEKLKHLDNKILKVNENSNVQNTDNISVSKKEKQEDKGITNDDLSNLKAEEIYAKYSKEKQDIFDKLFGKEFSSEKNFALSLIGKKLVPIKLKDINDKDVSIEKKETLLFLDDSDHSKNILKNINKFPENTKIVFPSLNKEKVKKLVEEFKLEKYSVIVEENNNSKDNDIKKITAFMYNTTAVPTMIAQDDNVITFAENNYDTIDLFLENSFKQPYLFR